MRPAIRVKKRRDKERDMNPMSRINYNRPYSLNLNVKVYDYGFIHDNDQERFFSQYQDNLSENLPPDVLPKPTETRPSGRRNTSGTPQNQPDTPSAGSYGAAYGAGYGGSYGAENEGSHGSHNESYGGQYGDGGAMRSQSYHPNNTSSQASIAFGSQFSGPAQHPVIPVSNIHAAQGVIYSSYGQVRGGSTATASASASRSTYPAGTGAYQQHPLYGVPSGSRTAAPYSAGYVVAPGGGDEDDDEDDDDDEEDDEGEDEDENDELQNYEHVGADDPFAQDDDDDTDDGHEHH